MSFCRDRYPLSCAYIYTQRKSQDNNKSVDEMNQSHSSSSSFSSRLSSLMKKSSGEHHITAHTDVKSPLNNHLSPHFSYIRVLVHSMCSFCQNSMFMSWTERFSFVIHLLSTCDSDLQFEHESEYEGKGVGRGKWRERKAERWQRASDGKSSLDAIDAIDAINCGRTRDEKTMRNTRRK